MTGSGGSRQDDYPRSTPIQPEGVSDPCNIVQRAPLNSPRPDVIAKISVGEVLSVNLNLSGVRPVLEVVAPSGIAGALTHRGHLTIIECIQSGRDYNAVVLSKSGGMVEIRVELA